MTHDEGEAVKQPRQLNAKQKVQGIAIGKDHDRNSYSYLSQSHSQPKNVQPLEQTGTGYQYAQAVGEV